MLLDACASFCAALDQTIGPTVTELLAMGALAALAWWRARKAITRVETAATAQIASAHEQASKAKAEARDAKVQIAELRGSLRPVVPTPLPPMTSGASGPGWDPVRIEMRPSSSGPSLDERLPSPPPIPDDVRVTPIERPRGGGGGNVGGQ